MNEKANNGGQEEKKMAEIKTQKDTMGNVSSCMDRRGQTRTLVSEPEGRAGGTGGEKAVFRVQELNESESLKVPQTSGTSVSLTNISSAQ